MTTSTFDRVPAHTSDEINRRIQQDIAEKVRYHAARVDEIPQRLRELEEEWDIERAIEANASALDDRFHEPNHGTGDLLADSSFAIG
jgi:hypothetical protein